MEIEISIKWFLLRNNNHSLKSALDNLIALVQ